MSTILAVDDSLTMRKCLEITFAGTEFNLVAVDTAQAALEKVKTLSPDLVIADVSLPPNDGYELCSTIKLAAPDLPVLMLSSKQNPFDPSKGAQADDHIDKPFDTQVMQDRARGLCKPVAASDTAPPVAAAHPTPTPATAAAKPKRQPERAPASSKIPAPRRKRPTPAMMTNPLREQPVQKGVSPAAAMRRTVPFAMPGQAKAGGAAAKPGGVRRSAEPLVAKNEPVVDRTKPIGAEDRAAADLAQVATPKSDKPAGDTLPGVPKPIDGNGGLAQLPADKAADMQTKLTNLGLNKQQIEGVLSLSREIIEQVVWDVVPTLAETLIKEEIARLTKE